MVKVEIDEDLYSYGKKLIKLVTWSFEYIFSPIIWCFNFLFICCVVGVILMGVILLFFYDAWSCLSVGKSLLVGTAIIAGGLYAYFSGMLINRWLDMKIKTVWGIKEETKKKK